MKFLHPQSLSQFSKLELFAKQVVEGFITGLHKSPFHGFSVEFAEHRLYNSGESTRHIDWKLFARSEKLFVKRYEEETNLRCQLVIDHSSSMYFPFSEKLKPEEQNNKLIFSVKCCAAIIELLKKQRDAVGLTSFSEEVEKHLPAKSNNLHHKLLYSELESLISKYDTNNRSNTSTGKALHQIAETIHKRSLVVIFSDMLETENGSEDIFNALQHLKHKKHEVILFHVTDKSKEIDFNFDNRPHKFIDLESGEEIKVNPSEIKDFYKQQIAEFNAKVKLKCNQYKIDRVEADINEGFEKVLHSYLVKRLSMN